MINFILFGSFFIFLLLNTPIAVSLGMSSILAMLYAGDKMSVIPTNLFSGMAKFLLLAIPFFVLSGNVMAEAGISRRLIAFIDDCVGHQKGGIAIVCVIARVILGTSRRFCRNDRHRLRWGRRGRRRGRSRLVAGHFVLVAG